MNVVRAVVIWLVRFLYRLALFPWLGMMKLGHAMASHVNWLLTGMSFEDMERINRNRVDSLMSRLKD